MRQVDRSRYSWCNNRPDLANAAERPNNRECIYRVERKINSPQMHLLRQKKIAKPLNVAQSAPLLGELVDSVGSMEVRISWACT